MKIRELMPLLRLHGRTVYDEEKEALFCNWSCAGFTVGVDGTYLKMKVTALSDQTFGMPNMPTPPPDWPCIGAVVDGELINRAECREEEQWVTLWESGAPEHREIRFIKTSENARGKLGVLEVETDGTFYAPEKKYARTMEIVGDSITCGFGNEAGKDAFAFHTMEENGWIAYGALAARELDYDFSVIAESGISAVQPEHPFFPMHSMEDVYRYADEMYDKRRGVDPVPWDFRANPKDIVVLNLGTNDSNPIRFYQDFSAIEGMEQWFREGYRRFVRMVRELNGPDTWILCSLGSMDYYLYYIIKEVVDEIRAETGDERIRSFEYIPINMMFEGTGAAGHPSAKTHARMGKELANYIRKFIGE